MGAEDWHDPHDLIPEQFRERFGDSETVAAALRRAESLPSSTPADERRCCPECYSVYVSPKSPAMADSSQRKPGAWLCNECREHFDEPLNMNPKATAFDWIDADDLADADDRGGLEGPISDLGDEWLRKLAIALYRPWHDNGPSYRDMAPLFPYTRYWIGKQVRAWKDGEHRDLVPDPTDEPEPAPKTEPPIDPSVAVARIGGDYDELVAERAASSDATAVATDGGRRRWDAYGS